MGHLSCAFTGRRRHAPCAQTGDNSGLVGDGGHDVVRRHAWSDELRPAVIVPAQAGPADDQKRGRVSPEAPVTCRRARARRPRLRRTINVCLRARLSRDQRARKCTCSSCAAVRRRAVLVVDRNAEQQHPNSRGGTISQYHSDSAVADAGQRSNVYCVTHGRRYTPHSLKTPPHCGASAVPDRSASTALICSPRNDVERATA